MADISEDLPVDPQIDPQASLGPGEEIVPLEQIDTSPAPVDPMANPQSQETDTYTTDSLGNTYKVLPDGTTSLYRAVEAPEDLPANVAIGGTLQPITAPPSTANDILASLTGRANGGTFSGKAFQLDPAAEAAAITQSFTQRAQLQQTLSSQRNQANNGDWRVRLRLAPGANYLYRAANPGILQPLAVTDGVIFPYTPSIDTAYKAEYDSYTLTHSNYKGYFYKSSYADAVNLKCTFTAQSTSEANYLLAVITFFKSVTKMFYGQDAQRGAPPPLVYLSGYGEYQFNDHPSVISQFNYNLPSDVDYIRAGSPNNVGLNLATMRDRTGISLPPDFAGLARLANAFLSKGALPNTPAPPSLTIGNPTYVPTKMEITLTLLPVQSRSQVSKQFSVKDFANGNLIKGGFW